MTHFCSQKTLDKREVADTKQVTNDLTNILLKIGAELASTISNSTKPF